MDSMNKRKVCPYCGSELLANMEKQNACTQCGSSIKYQINVYGLGNQLFVECEHCAKEKCSGCWLSYMLGNRFAVASFIPVKK